MTEQEMSGEFCKRTGRVATSATVEYFAFCEGVKMGREACVKARDERIIIVRDGQVECHYKITRVKQK